MSEEVEQIVIKIKEFNLIGVFSTRKSIRFQRQVMQQLNLFLLLFGDFSDNYRKKNKKNKAYNQRHKTAKKY